MTKLIKQKPENRYHKGVVSTSRRGSSFRRVLRSYVKDGREYQLHATKGWTSRKSLD